MIHERDAARVVELVGDRARERRPAECQIEREPLRGGLEAAAVERVTARYRDARGRPRVVRCVIKELVGPAAREAEIYDQLVARHGGDLAPRLIGRVRTGRSRALLYLEAIVRWRAWPWRELAPSQRLLDQLAAFHVAARDAGASVPAWDYDAELAASARTTLEQLERVRRHPDAASLARDALAATRRVVRALPRLRAQLVAVAPFGAVPLHGDVHTGNAIVRRRATGHQPVLIDWGRARVGSPLEDASSWLQSLGLWEPEARRRHDTLLAAYASAWGLPRHLGSELRGAYWLAGASNALAGALRYQLWVGLHAPSLGARAEALRVANDWIRVIRRAAAVWS